MYERYQAGESLAEVAVVFGVTRQSVYDMFSRRGFQLRSKVLQPKIYFLGEAYAPHADGYYRQTSGERLWLHQETWKHHNGPIPAGHHIHHRDTNVANNNIANLACLPAGDHSKIHNPMLPLDGKRCLLCNKPLERKRSPGGHLETPAAVRRRTYCDTTCQSAHKRGKPRGWSPRREKAENP